MIGALAEAGAALGRDDYLDAAVGTAEFVRTRMRDEAGRLLRTWKDGDARLNAYLEDHAYLLEALLALYEATFDVRWFDAARETADAMIERFADADSGGFFTTSHDHEELIARRKDIDDHPIPSGNSSAAYGLLRLAALTGEQLVRGPRRRCLSAAPAGRAVAPAGRRPPAAGDRLPPRADVKEVALVGPTAATPPSSPGSSASGLRPHLVLAGGPEGTDRPELMAGRTPLGGAAAAYVCERFACQAPGLRAERARRASARLGPGRLPVMATKSKPASAKQVATAYFDAIKARDVDAMAAVWKPGSTDHFYGMAELRVPEDLKAWFGNLFRAFPDFVMEVADMVAYGDKAAVRWTATGTFTGPGKFEGLTATGSRVELEGLDLLTISDGLIVENRAYTNAMEMARQMGAMPPAGSVGEKAMFGAVNARTAAAGAIQRLRDR